MPKKIEIIGWTKWDDSRKNDAFNADVSFSKLADAVVEGLRKSGYRFCGHYHQHGAKGVPILTGNIYFEVGMNMWGTLMASALGDNRLGEYSYILWNLQPDGKQITPEDR